MEWTIMIGDARMYEGALTFSTCFGKCVYTRVLSEENVGREKCACAYVHMYVENNIYIILHIHILSILLTVATS